jgi:hypothetical protein
MKDMKKRMTYKHGGSHDGNALARREEKRMKKNMGGNTKNTYGHGGKVDGEMPKAKPC